MGQEFVHLCDDMLAAVDDAGMLLTWRATTCDIVSQLDSITKVSAAEILFGDFWMKICITRHVIIIDKQRT